jgi:lysophospholipase L1-like esterase
MSRILVCVLLLLVSASPLTAQTGWRYTALGDSLAAGAWAVRGYVVRYNEYLIIDTATPTVLVNLGQPGWTSSDLLQALQNDSLFRYAVKHSKIVTWDIGGNDLLRARSQYKRRTCGGADNQDCLRAGVGLFKSNWDQIMAMFLELRNETSGNIKHTIIRTMDIYNPFIAVDSQSDTWPNDAGSDFVVLKPYLEEVNAYIASTSTLAGIPYARVYLAYNGPTGDEDPILKGYIAFDGLHPNDLGHKVMADLLRDLAYQPLR